MAKSSKSGEARPTRAPSRRRTAKPAASPEPAAERPAVQEESPVVASAEDPGSLARSSATQDSSKIGELDTAEPTARRSEALTRPQSATLAPEAPGAAAAGQQAPAAMSAGSRRSTSMPAAPGVEEVRRRAFELFIERGGRHGHDVEDWLRAERELMARR